jgi:hypothetical protein
MHISWTNLIILLFLFSWTRETHSVDWQVGRFFNASITMAAAGHFFDIKRKHEKPNLMIPNVLCSIAGSALISTLLYEEKHGIKYLPFLRNERTRMLKKFLFAIIFFILQNGLKQNYRDNNFVEFLLKQLLINIVPFFCAVIKPDILLKNPLKPKKKTD